MEKVHVRRVEYERGLLVRLRTLSVLGFDVEILSESEHDLRLSTPFRASASRPGIDRAALSSLLEELAIDTATLQAGLPESARATIVLDDSNAVTPQQIAELSRLTSANREIYLTSPAFDFGIFIRGLKISLWDSQE